MLFWCHGIPNSQSLFHTDFNPLLADSTASFKWEIPFHFLETAHSLKSSSKPSPLFYPYLSTTVHIYSSKHELQNSYMLHFRI